MLFLLQILVFFNSLNPPFQPGKYAGTQGTFFDKAQWFLQGKRAISVGRTLDLKADNTFNFQACDCNSTGTWINRNDTIYLQETTAQYSPMSKFSATRTSCSNSNYRISGNRLFRIQYDKGKTVECLEFSKN